MMEKSLRREELGRKKEIVLICYIPATVYIASPFGDPTNHYTQEL